MVVVLVALLSGAVLFGSGALGGSRERAAATLIVSGVRMGLSRANSTGLPTRMVFDLDADRITLEESSQRAVTREQDPDETEEEVEEGEADTQDAVDALESVARADALEVVEGPRAPPPRFTPVEEFRSEEGEEVAGRALGEGVELRSVHTQHDTAELTGGRAVLYFWPGGETENAVVHLGRADSNGLSVRISALTGRAKIEKGLVELPAPRADGEYSERDEE
jgi:general secretion pathway protein H